MALDALVNARGSAFLHTDPLRFPRRYIAPHDREAVALLAALFAYGNVKAMGDFLERLLSPLGAHPAAALASGRLPAEPPPYRFQRGEDVRALLAGVGRTLRRHGTLEACFESVRGEPEERLEAFARALRGACRRASPGLDHLLPLPSAGSACKRWRMFLRWVVRPDDGLDLGLWTCLTPAQLLIPVDVHVARLARALGLTRRATPDARFAAEATAALARFCPTDPTRYDFALARLGIAKECRGRRVERLCRACSLRPHCALAGR